MSCMWLILARQCYQNWSVSFGSCNSKTPLASLWYLCSFDAVSSSGTTMRWRSFCQPGDLRGYVKQGPSTHFAGQVAWVRSNPLLSCHGYSYNHSLACWCTPNPYWWRVIASSIVSNDRGEISGHTECYQERGWVSGIDSSFHCPFLNMPSAALNSRLAYSQTFILRTLSRLCYGFFALVDPLDHQSQRFSVQSSLNKASNIPP